MRDSGSTAPRGISLLQAMMPKARQQVDALTDILVQSKLPSVAVNVLCDSGFGWDPVYLQQLVTKLGSKRVPHFLFYLTCGPAARFWYKHLEEGFGAEISPETFRENILKDKSFQSGFQQLFTRLIPVIEAIQEKGGLTRVVPQLEDNQTNTSFRKMIDLLQEVIPSGLQVELGRNPCVGCYKGNEGTIPAVCFAEYHLHKASTDFNMKNGVISNDGCTYAFPDETPDWSPSLLLADFEVVQQKAGELDNWFLLWSAKYQGLGSSAKSPADRDYPIPTDREKQLLTEFLTKGTA